MEKPVSVFHNARVQCSAWRRRTKFADLPISAALYRSGAEDVEPLEDIVSEARRELGRISPEGWRRTRSGKTSCVEALLTRWRVSQIKGDGKSLDFLRLIYFFLCCVM